MTKLPDKDLASYALAGLEPHFPRCPALVSTGHESPATRRACAALADAVVMATAIAMCETGGTNDTHAYNPHATNAPAYGLWQENEGLGSRLFDPNVAAQHMGDTYAATVWRYWGCGPDHVGGYRKYLERARAAVKAISGRDVALPETIPGLVGSAPGDVLSEAWRALANPVEAIARALLWLIDPKHWLQLAEILGGAVLVVLGVVVMYRQAERSK